MIEVYRYIYVVSDFYALLGKIWERSEGWIQGRMRHGLALLLCVLNVHTRLLSAFLIMLLGVK